MKTVPSFVVLLLLATLTVTTLDAQSTYTLNPFTPTFGGNGDGSIRPGETIGTNPQSGNPAYISAQGGVGQEIGDSTANPNSINGFNQRGLSADPVTGNLIFVDTHTGSGGVGATNPVPPNAGVFILDPNSGQIVGALNTNGITTGSGQGPFVTAGAGDDGIVYTGNQVNSTSNDMFRIYSWPTANPSAPNFNSAPYLAFGGKLLPGERMAQCMDVRGSGTQTEIIVGTSSANGTGTNIYYFDTTNGTDFTAHRLFYPGITSPVFNDGIAFGPGHTFWTKQVGKPMYYLSYDTVNYTNNQIIATYTPTGPSDVLQNLASLSYDPTHHLMAALEEIGGTANGGPGNVWLFDIPDPSNHPPAVLASYVYPVNNVKATAPMGYVKFSNGRVYANVVNNGLLALTVSSTPLSPPTFTTDLPVSNRVAVLSSAHFEVAAVYDVTNYQWYSNNIAVTGANNYYYDIPNVTSNADGAVFKVVAFNGAGSSTSSTSTLKVIDPGALYHLQQLWSYSPGEGIMDSGGTAGAPVDRTIAYNVVSNQFLIAKSASIKITVVNPDTGTALYTMNTTGVSGGTVTLVGIACADDGAVYAANAASGNTFRIYRWADTGPNTLPTVIWGLTSSGGTANPYNPIGDLDSTMYRWGDDLAARGSGTATEIILDSQNNTKYAAILSPTDSTMTNWGVSSEILLANAPGSYGYQAYGTFIGRSIQFGNNNTFWQKRDNNAAGAPLAQMSYTPAGGPQLATLQLANTSLPIYTNGSTAINSTLNLAAAVNFSVLPASAGTTPDELDLYDIGDPTQALVIGRNLFKLNHAANNNAIAQVLFGSNPATGSNYVFALDANNGVMGLVLAGGVTPPPTFIREPKNVRILENTTSGLTAVTDEPAIISWYKGDGTDTGVRGTTLNFTNATTNVSGPYYAVANNVYGTTTSFVAQVTIVPASSVYTVTNIWSAIPGNGSFPYVSTNGGANTPGERAFAYNALSNQLVVVHCPPASTAYSIAVVDAGTGANLYTLNTTGVVHEPGSDVSGQNPIDLVGAGVADDGALYICGESPNASGGLNGDVTKMFHVYRWADTGPSTAPTLIYQGDPSNQSTNVNERWGDVMTARGSGTNTELIFNSNDGAYGAVLRPTDATMAQFTNFWFNGSAPGGAIGRSIQFGPTNVVYEKRKGNSLTYSTYDVTNNTSTLFQVIDPGSSTLGSVYVDDAHHIVAGVDFIGSATKPDALSFYDISDPNTPLFIGRVNFPVNEIANANFIAQVLITGTNVYALDANNGMIALSIIPPPTQVQAQTLSIALAGPNVIVSWPQQGSFTLQGTTSLTTPINWTDIGTGTASNGRYFVTNSISSQATFYRLRN